VVERGAEIGSKVVTQTTEQRVASLEAEVARLIEIVEPERVDPIRASHDTFLSKIAAKSKLMPARRR